MYSLPNPGGRHGRAIAVTGRPARAQRRDPVRPVLTDGVPPGHGWRGQRRRGDRRRRGSGVVDAGDVLVAGGCGTAGQEGMSPMLASVLTDDRERARRGRVRAGEPRVEAADLDPELGRRRARDRRREVEEAVPLTAALGHVGPAAGLDRAGADLVVRLGREDRDRRADGQPGRRAALRVGPPDARAVAQPDGLGERVRRRERGAARLDATRGPGDGDAGDRTRRRAGPRSSTWSSSST